MRALRSVGDPTAGQWAQATDVAYHLRRRLSAAEVASTGLVARDIRGTADAALRIAAMAPHVPASFLHIDSDAP